MKNCMKYLFTILIVSAGAFATVVWQPSSDGQSWDTPSAWSTGLIPAAGENALITSQYSCELNLATALLNTLQMGNASTAVLNINDGGTLNVGSGTLHVNLGQHGHSELNIYDGGSLICSGSARINLGWNADSVINQYGGVVETQVLVSLGNNSAYNISAGKLTTYGSLRIGNNNPLPDAFFNLSGTGEVEIPASGAVQVGFDSRNPSTGTINQTGGYMNVSASNSDFLLGTDAGTSGIYNMSGGDFDLKQHLVIGNYGHGEFNQSGGTTDNDGYVLVGKYDGSSGNMTLSGGTFNTTGNVMYVGNSGIGELEISGGTFNTTYALRLGRNEDAKGYLTISGGSVNIGGALQAVGPVVGATDPNQSAEITIIGSGATNITVGGRLDLRDKQDATINFRFDNGGITPITCSDHATMEATAITFGEIEGQVLLLGQQFDAVVVPDGSNIALNETNTYTNVSEVYDFSYEVVDLLEDGKVLRFTVTDIHYPDCEAAIAAGASLPADMNLDCRVDLADFAIMAEYWLVCNDPSGENCL